MCESRIREVARIGSYAFSALVIKGLGEAAGECRSWGLSRRPGPGFVPSARIVAIVDPGHSVPSTWTKMIESPSGVGASDSPRSTHSWGGLKLPKPRVDDTRSNSSRDRLSNASRRRPISRLWEAVQRLEPGSGIEDILDAVYERRTGCGVRWQTVAQQMQVGFAPNPPLTHVRLVTCVHLAGHRQRELDPFFGRDSIDIGHTEQTVAGNRCLQRLAPDVGGGDLGHRRRRCRGNGQTRDRGKRME